MDDMNSMVGEAAPAVVAPEATQVETVEVENTEGETKVEETAESKMEAKLARMEAKFEKRIQRLTGEKKSLEEKQRILEQAMTQSQVRQPTKADFPNEAAWNAYVQAEITKQEINKHELAKVNAQQQVLQEQAVMQDWSAKVNSKLANMPDFHSVVSKAEVNFERAPDVLPAIMESDVGPELAYYLAKNPDEADKIIKMTKDGRQRYLARLEVKLESQASIPSVRAPKPTAPAKVGGNAQPSVKVENMSTKDYFAMRNSGKQPW